VIVAHALTKTIGAKRILDAVSFEVREGVTALLGRNGAGKTTLMRILAGIWQPTSGRASIDGHDLAIDPVGAKRLLGYQPEHPDLHPRLLPRELLAFAAAARRLGPDAVARSAAEWEIDALLDTECGTLSQGQKRLVTLAAATMHRPPFLLLDEPTNALDPHRVANLKTYFTGADAPRAVLISTHQLDFAATIVDRYILLAGGRVIADGTLDALRAHFAMSGATIEEIVLRTT
jgi:ABC-type multidrug transport system ATPase subunit